MDAGKLDGKWPMGDLFGHGAEEQRRHREHLERMNRRGADDDGDPMPPSSNDDTSRAAAESVREDAQSLRDRVFEFIRSKGLEGATCDEVELALDLRHETASARVWELTGRNYRAGVSARIEHNGDTRKTRRRREARVYVALSEERQELARAEFERRRAEEGREAAAMHAAGEAQEARTARATLLEVAQALGIEHPCDWDGSILRRAEALAAHESASRLWRGRVKDSWANFVEEHGRWSDETFGPPTERGGAGARAHLRKELGEVDELAGGVNPSARHPEIVTEYADCAMLLFDAARRDGITPDMVLVAAWDKLAVNRGREWQAPNEDGSVEHVRGEGGER